MRISLLLLASLLPLAAIAQSSPNQAPDRTWITDVRIISPERLDHIDERQRADRRRAHRSRRTKNRSEAACRRNGSFRRRTISYSRTDRLARPSGFCSGNDADQSFDPAEANPMVQEYFKQLPRSYLYFGYTTLVDLAVLDRQVLEDFRQAPLHPDLYDCGDSLPFANGYPMSFAPPERRFKLFPNFIYDPKQAYQHSRGIQARKTTLLPLR